MVIVTDKKYFMEDFLKQKLDLYIERAAKKRKLDAVIIIDGDEGFGKTGISILCAYYIAQQTGREFTLKNVFFDPKEVIQFINSTKKQIIVWDEAALGGLASGWQSKVQQMLIQTLMTCRYRQHIIFFNVPKFYRLNLYFVTDRALGLIHVYSRDGIKAGKFTYYQKDRLEAMMGYWQGKKIKPYKKFTIGRLRGGFVDAFNTGIINEEEYDKKKDYFTNKLLSQYSVDRHNKELLQIKYKIYQIKSMKTIEKAEHFGVNKNTISEWGKLKEKYPLVFEDMLKKDKDKKEMLKERALTNN